MTEQTCSYCGKTVEQSAKNTYVEQLLESEKTAKRTERVYCNKQHFNKYIACRVILNMQAQGELDQVTATQLLEKLSP